MTALAHMALVKLVPSTLAREDEPNGNDLAKYQGDRHTIATTNVRGAVNVTVSIHPTCADTLST